MLVRVHPLCTDLCVIGLRGGRRVCVHHAVPLAAGACMFACAEWADQFERPEEQGPMARPRPRGGVGLDPDQARSWACALRVRVRVRVVFIFVCRRLFASGFVLCLFVLCSPV